MSPYSKGMKVPPRGLQMNLSKQAKAIAGGIVAFLLQVQVFVGQGGVETLQAVTLGQWITIVIGTLGSYGIVYSIPNKAPELPTVVVPVVVDPPGDHEAE